MITSDSEVGIIIILSYMCVVGGNAWLCAVKMSMRKRVKTLGLRVSGGGIETCVVLAAMGVSQGDEKGLALYDYGVFF